MRFLSCLLIMLLLAAIPVSANESDSMETVRKENELLKKRLQTLEPSEPLHMNKLPHAPALPTFEYNVLDVMESGKEVPFQMIADNRDWVRPLYKEEWHSTEWNGRFSYVPARLQTASHRIFPTYFAAGMFFEFEHETGLTKELKSLSGFIKAGSFSHMLVAVIGADVQKVIQKGNQLTLVASPKRTGLQLLTIPTNTIFPEHEKEPLLLQLVTSQGEEFDYNTIYYLTEKGKDGA